MKKFTCFLSLLVTLILGSVVFGQNQDAADLRFAQYTQMNQEQRVVAFISETPAMQAALQRRQIASKAPHLRLNPVQVAYLRQIFPTITEEVFKPGEARDRYLQDLNTQVPILFPDKEQVNALFIPSFFGQGVDQTVFFGNIRYVLKPTKFDENGQCYCEYSYWGCQSGYTCESYYGGCQPTTTGCGLSGGSACHGGCKYTGGEMEMTIFRVGQYQYLVLAV